MVAVLQGIIYIDVRPTILTLQHHALLDAFLKSTILTTVALCFGYLAGAVGHARVDASVLHGSLEESLAAKEGRERERERGESGLAGILGAASSSQTYPSQVMMP